MRMEVIFKKITRIPKTGFLCFLFSISIIQHSYAADLGSGEWFVRLIAEVPSQQLKDQGNVLGMLKSSIDGYDTHDLKELPPFGSFYLTIVFPHTDWGDNGGDYASDFHKRKHWRTGDEWMFVVKSNVPRNVTLSWQGYDGLKRLYRMRLMDMETGKIVRAVKRKKLQTYTFSMVGTSHRFKWIYLARPES